MFSHVGSQVGYEESGAGGVVGVLLGRGGMGVGGASWGGKGGGGHHYPRGVRNHRAVRKG